jgi:hypothetical protein
MIQVVLQTAESSLTLTLTATLTLTHTLVLYSYVGDDVHEWNVLHHHLPHSHGEGGSQTQCHLAEHSGQQKHLRVKEYQMKEIIKQFSKQLANNYVNKVRKS